MNPSFENIGVIPKPAAAVSNQVRQFVAFAIGEQNYCVDIMRVHEIRVSNTITPLPGAPDFVRGVINLRGAIVPICDLRLRFGQGRTELASSYAVVVVEINGRLQGLLVDEVRDIVTVPGSEIAAIPETDSNRQNPFFSGLVTLDGVMFIIVSLDRLGDSITN